MTQFEKDIESDIYWRQGQLSILKSLVHRELLSEEQREALRRYSVPAIYSLWEGFLNNIFTLFITEVNSKSLKSSDLHINYVVYTFDKEDVTNITCGREDVTKRRKSFSRIIDMLNCEPFNVKHVTLESNANYKVLCKITDTLNLKRIDDSFRKPLDRLLNFRNAIAHGDNSIVVCDQDIDSFGSLVESLMENITVCVTDGLRSECYLA